MIEKKFIDFIKQNNYQNTPLLLLVSGGVDSMVLLFLCYKFLSKENLSVLHINHNTRPENKTELELVKNTCYNYNINFVSETITSIPSKNKEQFWRKFRQKAAQKAKKKQSAQLILTAHHATDLTETVLFRLSKGGGLKSFFPFDVSTKPLWNISKESILNYAQQNKLNWKEDPSNKNLDFDRNMIRIKVLPWLKKITPNIEKVFLRESKIFTEYHDFISQNIPSSNMVELNDFLSWHIVIQKEWIKKHAQSVISTKEIQAILNWLHNHPQGNTHKKIGNQTLKLTKNKLFFS